MVRLAHFSSLQGYVVIAILVNLDDGDVHSMMRVCHKFHKLACTLLYRTLLLDCSISTLKCLRTIIRQSPHQTPFYANYIRRLEVDILSTSTVEYRSTVLAVCTAISRMHHLEYLRMLVPGTKDMRHLIKRSIIDREVPSKVVRRNSSYIN